MQSVIIKYQIINKICQALSLMLPRLRFGLSHSSVRDIYFHALNYASKSLHVITNLPSSFPLTFPAPASSLPLFTNTLYSKLLKYSPHLHHCHHHHHVVMHSQMLQGLQKPLSTREPETRPVCAVIDVMMGWTADVFKNFEGPIVGFFTSGACSAAWSVPCSRLASKMSNRERPIYFLGYPRIWLYSNRSLNTGLTGPFLVVHYLCEVRPVQRK